MDSFKIISPLILIAILNFFNISSAVEYFKYESRQGRQEMGSILTNNDKSSTNNINYKCPKPEYIHPCDCLELDKRLETDFGGSGEIATESGTTVTPTVEMTVEEVIHPDLIETVVFCKNIRNVQVLTDAIKGFQGHRINYFVLDGCKLPPFPNSLFNGVNIVWMELLNSTLQFHENFFNTKGCP